MGHAEETGRYISAQQIDIGQNTSIAAGTEVNFLGVIDAWATERNHTTLNLIEVTEYEIIA